MRTGRRDWVGGFSLMEVVISVGVIAVMVPIVMAFTVTGGKSSKVASDETRSSLLARSVAVEIHAAREGGGQVIGRELPWPDFPTSGGRVVLSADGDGNILEELGAEAYEQGIRGGEAVFLVSVRGAEHVVEGVTDTDLLSRVEISVEVPAAAKAEDRRKFVYLELMHRDD